MSDKSTSHCSAPLKLFTVSLFTTLLFFSLDLSLFTNYLGHNSVLPSNFTATTNLVLPSNSNFTTNSSFSWLKANIEPNYSENIVTRWLRAGGNGSRTANISIPGLDFINSTTGVRLSAGVIHEFVFSAVDEAGGLRKDGGDYFETDLSGPSWKSRPPVTDYGDGTYSVKLQLHPDYADGGSLYVFTVVLLFRSFEGLKFSPERFKYRKELRRIQITFYNTMNYSLPELAMCSSGDFSRELAWSGRWTKLEGREECPIDDEGRYRCLGPEVHCKRPWCEGQLGALESNGWVYSAHCSFKIFSSDSAWKCLNNKWLFLWGDSNHVDTIRNLLNFVLGLSDISSVPRRFDRRFVNPVNGTESVRITSIFNGHWNVTMNYLGLHSLRYDDFRELLWQYFREENVPDVLILNSGLHDGVYWKSIRAFVQGAEFAANFWEDVMRHLNSKSDNMSVLARPKLFYRTTIATGGYARDLAFNPSKMEAFNGIFIEKLKQKGLLTGGVIDQFDMTFPWHYDNRCNDGVHYGRAPAKKRWRDGEIGHQYFVDLMLGHVLLNAICNP